MVVFYIIFFWFLNNFINVINLNLKDNNFNLINEFFFCLDSFSTTFILFYLVLFFLAYDLTFYKILNLNKKKNFFFYLNLRFYLILLKQLIIIVFLIFFKKIKFLFFFIFVKSLTFFKFFLVFFEKKILIWKPLFKRWSYFGLWSKKNNKN